MLVLVYSPNFSHCAGQRPRSATRFSVGQFGLSFRQHTLLNDVYIVDYRLTSVLDKLTHRLRATASGRLHCCLQHITRVLHGLIFIRLADYRLWLIIPHSLSKIITGATVPTHVIIGLSLITLRVLTFTVLTFTVILISLLIKNCINVLSNPSMKLHVAVAAG